MGAMGEWAAKAVRRRECSTPHRGTVPSPSAGPRSSKTQLTKEMSRESAELGPQTSLSATGGEENHKWQQRLISPPCHRW